MMDIPTLDAGVVPAGVVFTGFYFGCCVFISEKYGITANTATKAHET